MKRVIVFFAAMFLLCSTSFAVSANLKIAVVDMAGLLKDSPQVAKIDARLKKKFTAEEQTIIKAQQKLRADVEKLQRNSSTEKQANLRKQQEKLIKEQKSLQEKQVQFMQKVSAAHSEELQSLLADINKVVVIVAKKEKIDLVLQSQSVLFMQDKVDITSLVLKEMKKSS